jgi:hypothetical protein
LLNYNLMAIIYQTPWRHKTKRKQLSKLNTNSSLAVNLFYVKEILIVEHQRKYAAKPHLWELGLLTKNTHREFDGKWWFYEVKISYRCWRKPM